MLSLDSVEVKSLTGMETSPNAMVAEAMGRAAMRRIISGATGTALHLCSVAAIRYPGID